MFKLLNFHALLPFVLFSNISCKLGCDLFACLLFSCLSCVFICNILNMTVDLHKKMHKGYFMVTDNE